MRQTSGPRTERIVRNSLVLLMIAAGGAAFIYDGWIGYPAKNFVELCNQAGQRIQASGNPRELLDKVSEKNVDAVSQLLRQSSADARREKLQTYFGAPATLEDESAIYFLGADCCIAVKKDGGVISDSLEVTKKEEKEHSTYGQLVQAAADPARVYPRANKSNTEELSRLGKTIGGKDREEALRNYFGGPPTFVWKSSPNENTMEFFFGQDAFVVHVPSMPLRSAISPDSQGDMKSLTDFEWQKRIGIVLLLLGVAWAVFLFGKVMRSRAEVSDEGLSLNGRKPIPFSTMKSLDTSEFRKKGRIYIVCEGDPAPRVLFDEYHYAEFDKLMAALCEKTGFDDPVAQEKAAKAQAATGANSQL